MILILTRFRGGQSSHFWGGPVQRHSQGGGQLKKSPCMSSGYWGCAAGKAKSAAKTELEKIKMADMTCEELIKEAAKIIYQVLKDVMCTR